MQIDVSGKGVDVGESFREHVEAQVAEHVNKYIDRVTSIDIVLSKEAHMFRVDIVGNLGTHAGIVIRGKGTSTDVYAAFDASLEKVSKQLRRYKRKITNHHKYSAEQAPLEVAPRVKGVKTVLPSDSGESDDAVVIAEKPTDIDTLTVSEAVMKMDLEDLPAVMFFNKAHGQLNVVYRREDGNISWVDPKLAAAEKAA